MSKIEEIWKDVVGYEGLYQVSDESEIRSVKRNRIMRHCTKSNGYKHLAFSINGKAKYFLVHRIIAIAFIPNPENKSDVNHIDGDKSNNKLNNLEWCTKSENCSHAYNTGLQPVRYAMNAGRRKLSEDQVKEAISMFNSGELIKKIAKKYGVSATAISGIVNRKSWTYLTNTLPDRFQVEYKMKP